MWDPALVVIAVVTTVSLLAAVILYVLSNQRFTVKVDPADQPDDPDAREKSGNVSEDVLDELKDLPIPENAKGRVAKSIASYLDTEMEKQRTVISHQFQSKLEKQEKEISTATHQLKEVDSQYKKVTDEKNQTE